MSRHYRRRNHGLSPLPWQLELACIAIGVVCVPVGMWLFLRKVTGPAEHLAHQFGVQLNLDRLLEQLTPIIWISGALFGWRVGSGLRSYLRRKLDQVW